MPCRTFINRAKPLIRGAVLSGLLMLLFPCPVARADRSVTLTWIPSAVSDAAGYKIYYGPASHDYSSVVNAGNTTTITIPGLVEGKTYYFAATTYDAAGDESAFSNEASYVVPVTPASLSSGVRSGERFSFNVSGVTGYQYVVQASTNLANWISVQTNTAPFTFTDTNAANFGHRFYRAFYLPL